MAKGQLRSNRETKKPKQAKTPGAPKPSPFSASQSSTPSASGTKK